MGDADTAYTHQYTVWNKFRKFNVKVCVCVCVCVCVGGECVCMYGAPEDVLSTEAYMAKYLTNADYELTLSSGMYNKHKATYEKV